MILKKLTKNFYISFIIIFLIFSLDRISKLYVVYLNKNNYALELFLSKFLNISLIWNEGIAFGLLSFNESYIYNIITLIIISISIIIMVIMFNSEGFKKYSLIFVFGGSISNLFDRIYYSAVPDFIDLHYKSFHWFIFNMADIFITFGVICLIFAEIFYKNNEYEKNI